MKQLLIILAIFTVVSVTTDAKAETNTVSSTVVTNSTPPTANAPTIMNNNSDICKVGVGASVQNNIVGLATGVVIDDELCQKLKLSRSMYAYGMKVAAVSILCQDPRVWDAMTDAGTPCPAKGSIGVEAAQYWSDNPDEIPDGSKYKNEYVIANKPEPREQSNEDEVLLFKTLFIILTGIVLF
jgi:hypothetical protein|tara:strand:- start:1570 stop:2118 length:549 start_codon:yes stop_codon:yes gene_type:complete